MGILGLRQRKMNIPNEIGNIIKGYYLDIVYVNIHRRNMINLINETWRLNSCVFCDKCGGYDIFDQKSISINAICYCDLPELLPPENLNNLINF